MSLLSPDRVIVGLSPTRLQALRVGGRLRQHVIDKYHQQLDPSDITSWRNAINELEILLATTAWNSDQVFLILSNHWVRYALVPGKRSLGSAEQNALAAIVFEKTYGPVSLEWEIRTSLVSSEGAMVASGIPKALLEAIRAMCGKRLGSIRPLLMPVANTASSTIKNESGRLVIDEPGRITFASIHKGQWQSISSRAIPVPNESVSLNRILEEDRILQKHESNGLLWFCNIEGKLDISGSSSDLTQFIQPKTVIGISNDFSLVNWGVHQ